MTAANPAVHPHAQQNGNGNVCMGNGQAGSAPKAFDASLFFTIISTITDVVVFLGISIGYILQVSVRYIVDL